MATTHYQMCSCGERGPHSGVIGDVTCVRCLTATWRESLSRRELHGTEVAELAEQDAYDRLVDFVEAHDLNGTEHDPRGTYA